MEVLGLLKRLNFDTALNYLVESNNASSMVLESPLLETERAAVEKSRVIYMREPFQFQWASGINCAVCGGQNIRFRMVQFRSGDESMTTWYFCADCGNNWKSG
jgi:DNA-directed RNA polymerase subunit M/transcription elongation factor TFIIS